MSAREEGVGIRGPQVTAQDVPAAEGAIELQCRKREKQKEEMAVIASSKAVVDPRAMVIALRHAGSAEGAVFAASWLSDLASPADLAGPKEDVVVGVCVWVAGGRGNVMSGVDCGEIGEDVRCGEQYWNGKEQRGGQTVRSVAEE